jgi:membrane fusion protein, multidrug efflux system
VLVAFANLGNKAAAPRVAGLYAEGRIEVPAAVGASVLMLPDSAIARSGQQTFVWRVQDGALKKTAVQLGARDVRSGDWPVTGGVAAGDKLLRHPSAALVDGQKVQAKAPA